MPIKDRDGNVYKLRGPNPIIKDQNNWDGESIKLINLGYKSEVVEDKRNPVKEFAENVVTIKEKAKLFDGPTPDVKLIPARDFIREVTAKDPPAKKAEPKPEPKPEIVRPVKQDEPVQINVDKQLAKLLKDRGAVFLAAPVLGYIEHVDDLYGTSYKTAQYGDQFPFDAIVIDQSDLQIQFWCVRQLTKNTIVYRKVKEGAERWWKVDAVESKTGGWLVVANISDLNPDFS